ncbi:MAG: hypothetical protein JW956_02215 [Calditrichaceae bacterium]|nr:hypothetical protein [Calditrichaceae bacterium]
MQQSLIYLIFWVIVFAATGLFAQEKSLIEVQSEVDTSTITIGDRINYSITIDRDKDLRIMKPGEGLNLGMFEIKDYKFHDPLEKDGRLIEKYEFNISVYDTGKFTIPPFPIAYFPVDTSQQYKIIEAPAIDIYVQSVISGDDARELKDIKFPLAIPFNYFFWISMAVVIILVAVIAYLGYLLWKRRKEKGYIFSPPPPPRPAHEVALEALEQLFQSNLLDEKQFKEFFSRLSDIIRAYLEGRYFFDALEETTREIMADAKKHVENNDLLSDLKNILELSDLIKFAKYIPEDKEIDTAIEQSLNFVNVTKLIYEVVPENGLDEETQAEEGTLISAGTEDTEDLTENKK